MLACRLAQGICHGEDFGSGSGSRFGATRGRGGRRSAAVSVRVRHCDLRDAGFPVMVGHYIGDTIAGTEKILDKAQGGRISRRRSRGLHPGATGTFDVYLDRSHRQVSGVVVGLGSVANLTRGELIRTARTGLVALADLMQQLDYVPEQGTGRGVSTVLIGSGGGVVSQNDSIVAILTAVRQANEILGMDQGFRQLEIVEVVEQRAIAAWHMLRRLLKTSDRDSDFQLEDGGVQTGKGGWRQIGPDAERDWFTTVTIQGGRQEGVEDSEDTLRYQVVGNFARADARIVGMRRQVVEGFARRLADSYVDDSDYSAGRTLFELLWPRELKNHSPDDRSIRLVLDTTAAALPWEMLDDRRPDLNMEGARIDLRPVAVRIKLVRQLIDNDPGPVQKRSGDGRRALVVGDPRGGTTDERFQALPGAVEEAKRVQALLDKAGYKVEMLLDDATPEKVMSRLLGGSWDVIHFASHGVVDFATEPNGEPRTGIVIGGTPIQIIDSELLGQLPTTPDLVFVNCCLLGKVDRDKDKEFLRQDRPKLASGVAVQLIRMGVQAVVAAGWEVDDTVAGTFADKFYQGMLSGGSFGTATFDARSGAFEENQRSSTWGAYQCYGDPDFRLPDRSGENGDREAPVFATPSEALARIERAVAEIDASGSVGPADKAELEALREAIDEHGWLARGEIKAALGSAYAKLCETELAIKSYTGAAGDEDGAVSIHGIEELFRLMADPGLASTTDAIGPITTSIEKLERLNDLCGPTAARYQLIGICHERIARLRDNGGRDAALAAAERAYRAAAAVGEKSALPAAAQARARALIDGVVLALRGDDLAAAQDRAREFGSTLPDRAGTQGQAKLLELIADGGLSGNEAQEIIDVFNGSDTRPREVAGRDRGQQWIQQMLDDRKRSEAEAADGSPAENRGASSPPTPEAPAGVRGRAAGRRCRSRRGHTRPWQCLYFLPEPQGQGSLRPLGAPGAGVGRIDAGGERRAAPAIAGTRASAGAGWAAATRRRLRLGLGAGLHLGEHRLLLLRRHHLHVGQHPGDLEAQPVQQALEQLEGLGLVLVQRVALGVAAEADDAAQVVERDQVLAPVLVDGLQQHLLLDRAHGLGAVARGLGGHLLVGGARSAARGSPRRRRPPRPPSRRPAGSRPKTWRTCAARPSMSHWSA